MEHRQDSREEEAAAGVAEVRKFPEISPKEELLVCWVRVGAGGSLPPNEPCTMGRREAK